MDSDRATSYRVRCLATGYLTWTSSEVSATPTLTAAAPTAPRLRSTPSA
jgi:hypothetical protein